MRKNWMFEIDVKLNATNPDEIVSMFQVQKVNENGIPVYGEHGIKTPQC